MPSARETEHRLQTACPARSIILDTGTHLKCSRSRGFYFFRLVPGRLQFLFQTASTPSNLLSSPFQARLKPQFNPAPFPNLPVFDESRPSGDNRRVASLSKWACGAAGSALPWHGRGHRFDPDQVHQSFRSTSLPQRCSILVYISNTTFVTRFRWPHLVAAPRQHFAFICKALNRVRRTVCASGRQLSIDAGSHRLDDRP